MANKMCFKKEKSTFFNLSKNVNRFQLIHKATILKFKKNRQEACVVVKMFGKCFTDANQSELKIVTKTVNIAAVNEKRKQKKINCVL